MKISIIGSGNVGATAAWQLLQKDFADIAITDVVAGIAEGKALDMAHAAALLGLKHRISGISDISQIKNSDVVVITAGLARKPGMTRLDLLQKNSEIVRGTCASIKEHAPDAIVIVVTNPLDVMTYLALRTTGFSAKKVFGMAGVLDTARFRHYASQAAGVAPDKIETSVLGSHGDLMLPLLTYTKINGIPIAQALSKEKIDEIVNKTRNAGAEVVALLQTGSAYYAPAASIAEMVESIVRDEKKQLPICAYLNGEYGLNELCIGVPCILGKNGIEKIVELELSADEKTIMRKCAEEIKQGIKELNLQ